MELMPEGRNFRLIQEDELPQVLDYLAEHLPESLKFHQTIKTYLHDRVWDFHFYVSKTWPEDPIILHFPGITSLPDGRLYDSFSIFCPVSRLDSLKLLAEEDVLVDWSRPIFLNFTHSQIVDKLQEYCSHRLGCVEKVRGDIYVCERGLARVHQERWRSREQCDGSAAQEGGKAEEEDAKEEESLLAEAQLRQLGPEHAAAIHSLYPANDMESVEVFERLIRALPAFGVFSSDGELAAWMVQSYYGAMFSMQTLPAFRRRGYGLLLARRLTSAVLARGYIPFVVIRPENSASQSLYSKLGFRRRYETVRAILRPKGWPQGADGEEAVVPEGSSVGGEEELTEAEVPEAERSRGEAEVPEGD